MRSYLTVILFVGFGMIQASSMPASAQSPVPAERVSQRYEIDVTLDAELGTIAGSLRLEWINHTGKPQSSLPFRLYPNGAHYGDGSITTSDAKVEGRATTPDLHDDPTVLTVSLGADVHPGESVSLTMSFETVIPTDLNGGFGILQHLPQRDWWALADWYPVVAGWERSDGWYLDPPTSFGDPTFASSTAMYDVTVEHPAGYLLIGAGEEHVSRQNQAGQVTTTFSETRLREFAMTALPAGEVTVRSFDVAGQPVTVTIPDAWVAPDLMSFMEERAKIALPLYAEWFGVHSEVELDITVAVLSGALGVSWDQVVWFDLASIAEDGTLGDAERMGLEPVIYHELGHQWLAAAIGANSNDHTFLTEGLVNTLVVAIVRETDGARKARSVMGGFVAGPYRAFTNGNQDGIVDQPISEDRSGVVHSFLVYGKAGVGFEAIRQEIGDTAFFQALMRLGSDHADGFFTPDHLLRLFEETSGQELDELWSFWFLEATTEVDDVDAVVAGSGR